MTRGILSLLCFYAGILLAAGPDSSAITPAAADSVAPADSSIPGVADSLKAGVKADTALAITRRNCVSPGFAFMIPVIREFEKLRSQEENRQVSQHMDQDAEERFDENDICFPAGVAYGRAVSPWFQARAGVFFYSISNANAWTPRANDSLYTEKHVNAYSLKALQVSLEAQFNISRALLTVNNFNRVYLAVLGEFYPLVSLGTERTELGKRLNGRGTGFGPGIGVGIERYLSGRASLTGEMGYSVATLGHFRDGGTLRFSDVFVNGTDGDFTLVVKSLRFRFFFSRWF